ncbi:hypothetical protein V866_000927 [Kwoniella sp. B9012]|uniref:Uncharacterized protein n=2 Tax=Kwoniella TaxID=490731 RepID=A0A1B9IYB3_9TREE|nr:uncharacterized protein I203_00833 [Kwoniella mangroviensis CBS 8507]OCF60517.1 hypothetical protein L486_00150 [Kwoniella mangroviensis CBS 10435]OCF70698.1 hypothetical protein I203_00833 [Kwoniella mangroviensis CBS 8507]
MVSAPVYDKSDPRSDKVFPYHLPLTPEWSEYKDPYGQTAMTAAGAGMFVKQPIIVWGAFILAVISLVNSQPLRQSKDSTSPLLTLGMGFAGVLANIMPKMMLAPQGQTDVPTPSP